MTVQAPAQTVNRGDSRQRLSFPRAVHSEWIKLATLRSTWWSIGLTAVLTVGIAVLIAQAVEAPGFAPIQAVVLPIQFTMLLAGILGAISVTGEYSTGMIRSTLTADPVRGSVLAAKAVVLAVFLFVSSLIIFGLAAVAVSLVVSTRDVSIDWSDPAASFLPILVASLAMAVFALIGVAFGFIIRSGAGAIAATVGLLFVLPVVSSIFAVAGESWKWLMDAANYLPVAAAQSVIIPGTGLDEPVAYLTLACWVVAGMLSAWAVLRTRDA
ncbi:MULTISPECIES: ABC transporter permease [unclassified Microbacterium]|uniref:ABC transporter permease n=1 Tax=unclassified Microbacterium TaxID=2609290 RepID=UPI000EAA0D06|nr:MULTISPECIES: ABC transporter permease [unclassified Microbacterium]MBT2483173.1 ABC transporter permease [Microbacterium sp. ISL-108]RKN66228.1 ABC transporter permease [Microbacterium sp. CGR2]